MGPLLVAFLAALASLPAARSQECPMGTLEEHCRCNGNNEGTFDIICGCPSNQDLVISEMKTLGLSSQVVSVKVQNCNATVTVRPNAFSLLFQDLQHISFSNITNLVLEKHSLSLELYVGVDISIDSVLLLSLQEDAIVIENQYPQQNISITNSFITELQPSAIKGNFSNLSLEKVIVGSRLESKTFQVGDESDSQGCVVTIMESSFMELAEGWLSGSVKTLQLENNTFTLLPKAFSGITLMGDSPLLILKNNEIGKVSPLLALFSQPQTIVSLPSGSLDFSNGTMANSMIVVEAANNRVNCSCESLVWLQEKPCNTPIKEKVDKSLVCRDDRAKCTDQVKCTASQMMLSVGLVFTILITRFLM